MAPRLDSSFLRALRDVVGPTRLTPAVLEGVVQQQLLHGGTLDTLLLEAGVVDEAAVVAALCVANGTAAVAATTLAAPTPAAVRRLPARMATTMCLLPLSLEDGATGAPSTLHVACRGPVDGDLCAELGALLGLDVVAHAVPEVRVRVGLHRAYGAPLDERFAALLRLLDGAAPTTTTAAAPADGAGGPATLLPTPASGAADDEPPVDWDLVEALAHLAAQDGRDGVARVATTFARRFMPFAALVGVRDGALVGWRRSGPAEGVAFSSRPFALPSDAFLAPVLASTSPYLGRVPPGEANDALLGWLGRRRPRTVLVSPVHVAGRAVAALWADADVRAREPRELGELVAFSARLGGALEALLRQRQRQHPSIFPTTATTPPSSTPSPAAIAATPTTAAATPATTATDGGVIAAPITAAPPRPSDDAPTAAARTTSTTTTLAPPVDPAPPRPTTTATSPRDGTSPFARTYVPPVPADDTVVIASVGGGLLDGSLLSRARAGDDVANVAVPALFQLDEAAAPGAWRAALRRTVEQGLQGGSVDEANDWEDVAWDPAPAIVKRSAVINFTALSTSTLAGIDPDDDPAPGDEGNEIEAVAPPSAVMRGALDDVASDDERRRDVRDERGGRDARAERGDTSTPTEPLATLSSQALAERLLDDDDDVVARALRLLVGRGAAAVPALAERFPGRLRVDPFDPGHNVQTPAEVGPVVDALAQLGKVGLDAALPHLDSRHPAHRFAAVLLFVATHDVRAVELLRARLYDAEPRIRALAVDAILPFLAHKRFEPLLVHLRERVVTERLVPTESRRRAVELLGVFRDVGAVPLLIGQLGGPVGDSARTTLRAITLQDHGARARTWEKWWAKAKKSSRVDWLIEALGSEELELRRAAHAELRTVTGDDFGYRPDAERRIRQRAVVVWQQWWADERKQAEDASR